LSCLVQASPGLHDRAKHGAEPNWQVRLGTVRHTVPGTHAGAISQLLPRWSSAVLPIGSGRPRPCAALSLRPLPRPGAQVVICSRCDRGHIYCAGECARRTRGEAQRAAGRRYQGRHCGRVLHAARARRYRIVTHHSSPLAPADDLLSTATVTATSDAVSAGNERRQTAWRCHWCGCRCPPLIRQGFLRCRGPRRGMVPAAPFAGNLAWHAEPSRNLIVAKALACQQHNLRPHDIAIG
jgi:hypothetical protein